MDENNHATIQKPYYKNHLPIGGQLVECKCGWIKRKFYILIKFNNISKYETKPFDLKCKVLKAKMVLKVGEFEESGAMTCMRSKYLFTHSKINLW